MTCPHPFVRYLRCDIHRNDCTLIVCASCAAPLGDLDR